LNLFPTWSPVTCSIEFDTPGRRIGKVRVPIRGTEAAEIVLPIAAFVNGQGPTVLLTGGVHGDEYEGPLALSHLVRSLPLKAVKGRVIVIPFLNQPALRAAQRRSPIDALDLNRSFPGSPMGSPSEVLAHWISSQLVPQVDAVIDMHTGGVAGVWLPLAMMHPQQDRELHARMLAALTALRTPIGVVLDESEKGGMFDSYVESQGKIFICCEFGGGMLTRPSLDVAQMCARNALRHFGMFGGGFETPDWPGWGGPRLLQALDHTKQAVAARTGGLFEPRVDLGTAVRKGDVIGLVHPIDDLSTDPEEVKAPQSGILFQRRASARIEAGDRAGMVASELKS
jgi:N-alpha-acetyl-L-2,4-diaminobutyrate deacetylase